MQQGLEALFATLLVSGSLVSLAMLECLTSYMWNFRAIFYGLSLAWDSGYRNTTCFSDCLEAMHLVLVHSNDIQHY
jgi:hypothetical protein